MVGTWLGQGSDPFSGFKVHPSPPTSVESPPTPETESEVEKGIKGRVICKVTKKIKGNDLFSLGLQLGFISISASV